MDIPAALRVMASLASETRLWVLKLLVEAGPEGLSAGEIADSLGARQNTMSTHLKQLALAGLVRARRQGRQVVYAADCATIDDLAAFLVGDCCGGAGVGGRAEAFPAPVDQGFRLNA